MKKNFYIFLFLIFAGTLFAQEEPGVIKIRRPQLLKKAEYDETTYKVIAIDRYGNPKEESIAAFELHINKKGKLVVYSSSTNTLTPEMLKELKSLKKATKVWFTKIKGQESDGHLVDLPDFDYMIFPKCENCGKANKGK